MENKWMLLVMMGFLAGAIFGLLINLNSSAQEQAKANCGICQQNLETMIGNYNVLAKTCQQPFSKDVPILPGVINGTVKVYVP